MVPFLLIILETICGQTIMSTVLVFSPKAVKMTLYIFFARPHWVATSGSSTVSWPQINCRPCACAMTWTAWCGKYSPSLLATPTPGTTRLPATPWDMSRHPNRTKNLPLVLRTPHMQWSVTVYAMHTFIDNQPLFWVHYGTGRVGVKCQRLLNSRWSALRQWTMCWGCVPHNVICLCWRERFCM